MGEEAYQTMDTKVLVSTEDAVKMFAFHHALYQLPRIKRNVVRNLVREQLNTGRRMPQMPPKPDFPDASKVGDNTGVVMATLIFSPSTLCTSLS